MQRPTNGRGLFHTRDSGGKHEMTPAQYVQWASREANERQVRFSATPETIQTMIRMGVSHDGDVFLDYDVCGNQLSREGLNALIAEVKKDESVSHIFIPRRDRLARPDDPIDALILENSLRRMGVTLVFMDRVCPPIPRGHRLGIEEILAGVIDYDRAGKDRRELAQKIIYAQLSLAKGGYSTGGRPPYGFRRWLVRDDGTQVRQLEDGERVRMRGHHVVWLPGPATELAVIHRILKLLVKSPATQVARLLTKEGVASPDAGRMRTDNGTKHLTSGVWHQTTIINIARNPLLLAICSHGRRSMGDQLRFTSNGPRSLTETDYRSDSKPKVVRNPDTAISQASAHFSSLVEPTEQNELIQILDARAGSQRGKPRSRDPDKNPLGSRIFDLACGWPMYRMPYNGTFRYTCGAYLQSKECEHNHVEGPMATRFVLACLRQRILAGSVVSKLNIRLQEIAAKEHPQEAGDDLHARTLARLEQVKVNLAKAARNLALADNNEQYSAIAGVFEELKKQQVELEGKLASSECMPSRTYDSAAEVNSAMAVLDYLPELAADEANLRAIGEALTLVNVRLFLGFQPIQAGKRILNKLRHGILCFGDAPPPVPLYAGPTGRRAISTKAATVAAGRDGHDPVADHVNAGREEKSLRNVSRGERI